MQREHAGNRGNEGITIRLRFTPLQDPGDPICISLGDTVYPKPAGKMAIFFYNKENYRDAETVCWVMC